ncbi:MAG: VOC family protein [Crocinitomicaceae bacterium]|nr:VOC family protein [Flavobacteriales bacterium]NQZ38382.1 VOC family protein [Crocinitomicaceae bacterium]
MAEVIGIGGIFLKFNDPAAMREWYSSVLGMQTNDYGVLFEFNGDNSPNKGQLQLGTFPADSDYFGKGSQQTMINFRVDDLVAFAAILEEKKVKIVDTLEAFSYGKFLHIEDPEGNRIELWEPVNEGFSESKEPKVVMR